MLDLIRDAKVPCPKCKGSGVEEWPLPVHRPGQEAIVVERPCSRCKGTGKITVEGT